MFLLNLFVLLVVGVIFSYLVGALLATRNFMGFKMTFRIKILSFTASRPISLPLEEAKRVISEFACFECIEQIWVFDGKTWQEQIS